MKAQPGGKDFLSLAMADDVALAKFEEQLRIIGEALAHLELNIPLNEWYDGVCIHPGTIPEIAGTVLSAANMIARIRHAIKQHKKYLVLREIAQLPVPGMDTASARGFCADYEKRNRGSRVPKTRE